MSFASFNAATTVMPASDPNTIITAYFFCDHKKNVGDANALKGIAAALAEIAQQNGFTLKAKFVSNEIDPITNQSNIFADFVANNPAPNMVFGAGDSGLRAIKSIQNANLYDQAQFYWAGHQPFAALYEQADKLDLIALPVHTMNNEQLLTNFADNACKVTFTIGVAHNVTPQSLEVALNNWQNNNTLPQIPAAKKYIGVYLGGDAPLPTGEQRLYTSEEAKILAAYVSKIMDADTALLLVNGNRTGKYDAQQQLIPNTHVNQIDNQLPATAASDHVTAAFLDNLPESIRQRTFFYDFRANAARSAEPVMATLINNPDSLVFLPGESTSMISECLLNRSQVMIVRNNAMNSNHHAHVDSMLKTGYQVLRLQGENIVQEQSGVNNTNVSMQNAAQVVAQRAWGIYASYHFPETITVSDLNLCNAQQARLQMR